MHIPTYVKTTWRIILDGAVILMAIFFIWTFAPSIYYLFATYEDLTIPDEVVAVDEEIDAFLETAQHNFAERLENPQPLDSYEFLTLENRVALTDTENYAQSADSVVYITTVDAAGWVYNGSGTILTKDGVILTNYHVITGSEAVVVTTTAGETFEVTDVIAYDEALDIAFLKIDAEELPALPLGDSTQTEIGEKTLVIGHPEGFLNSLSLGNLSGIRNYRSQGAGLQFQITNPISGGNSGGAVLNEYGELIAVPTWFLEYEDNIVQVQNINFAVPIHEAVALLE